jgi:tetratricopeptide (TPR) repeat protein
MSPSSTRSTFTSGISRFFTVVFFFQILALSAAAQRTGNLPGDQGSLSAANRDGVPQTGAPGSVIVRVLGSRGIPLQQQAFVQLYKVGAGTPLMGTLTSGPSEAAFASLPQVGWYTVEVSAAGYRTQRKDFDYSDLSASHRVDVTMVPDSDDGNAAYIPLSTLPAKLQKHLERGIAEFRAGDFKAAEKEFTAAYNAAPKSAETNYLLGLLFLRTKTWDRSETHFNSAVSIDPGYVPALSGLGQVRYQKGDLNGAAEVLEKAITIDRKQWEPFWVLSEVHLRQHDFEKARKEAATAVELGKGAANGAKFIEGSALAELGQNAEALKMLQSYLKDVPSDSNAPAARELCAQLETEIAAQPSSETLLTAQPVAPSPNSNSIASGTPLQALTPNLQIVDWEPLDVDDEKLALADGVTCPSEQVITEAGKRVTEFVDNVNRIDATEQITHEQLSALGRPVAIEKRKFDYLISISADDSSGFLTIDESRQGRDAQSGQFLDHVSMFGLADLPLVFHPSMRGDFQLTCEGLGKWQDRATWLVYFRQRPDRPERLRAYGDGYSSFSAGLKGRAWISADTYQIVRLEANLMKPIPQIGLGSEEDVVEYGPVPFRTKNTVLWLPSNADIYYYYRHKPFHRHHIFSNYNLFSVSASQKLGQPAIPDEKDNPH